MSALPQANTRLDRNPLKVEFVVTLGSVTSRIISRATAISTKGTEI